MCFRCIPASAPQQGAGRSAAGPCASAVATVHAWAEAWSRQDAASYLGYYGREFSPSEGLTRKAWEARRRQRIEGPGFIGIEIVDPEVEACEDGRARLTFLQVYSSDLYRDRVRKELRMSS